MKVAVFGAGALGAVHGVLLAREGGVDVSFIVRPERAGGDRPIVIERVRGDRRLQLDAPERVSTIPADADAILLAVGTESLVAIEPVLAPSRAPIVVLTPMLPREWARMKEAFGERVHAALPRVIAYAREQDGVFRYWLAPSSTWIDEPREQGALDELASALTRAGLRGRFALGVHETNPATTVRFIPIGMAIAIAGSVARLAADDALLDLTAAACREGGWVSDRIGRAEAWTIATPILSAPWALRLWLGALGKVSPEALFYAEEHFGRKLREQHRLMIHEMIDLAREKELPHAAFDAMAARLDAR